MEWTKSDTLKFIELWQGFPCLWNTKSLDYKNRQKRRDALLDLAQEMSMDINYVEKKMNSLKTQFNREIHKMKTKSEAGLEVAQSSWYAFEYLLFLKDIKVPNPNMDSIMVTLTDYEQESDLLEEKVRRPECTTKQLSRSRSTFKRKRNHQLGMLNLLKGSSNVTVNKQRKDEFSTFGDSIASELRDIRSERHLLILKKEIMDLVFRTKLDILDSQNTVADNIQYVTKTDPIEIGDRE